ncbi:hypothetical protein LR48_Vigan04g080100 [Vigna angularis]|uniref:Uncharacterized protein n=1 Tax=Phaseolus angularis TaxID=3914 RepID=A0A0L9UCX0_PHAAN|nr:hypothetical protein LR48_Vigan04g080100 [Vigna angularis]
MAKIRGASIHCEHEEYIEQEHVEHEHVQLEDVAQQQHEEGAFSRGPGTPGYLPITCNMLHLPYDKTSSHRVSSSLLVATSINIIPGFLVNATRPSLASQGSNPRQLSRRSTQPELNNQVFEFSKTYNKSTPPNNL